MASKPTSDIVLKIDADISGLSVDLDKAGKRVATFGKRGSAAALKFAKAASVIGAAFVGIGAGALAMAKSAANSAAEIENLARIANTTPETFQRMAAASRTVGVEQDKLADILKDVQDKIGDFLETGGGPMADFFENIAPKIGVTADQFRDLSGPDALQLYVSSLERANLSQNQMTFYLEALASDATALLPLLRNNGSEMERLGQKAADAGTILSNEAVAGAAEMKMELDQLGQFLSTEMSQVILDHKAEIMELAEVFTTIIVPAIINVAKAFAFVATKVKEAHDVYQLFRNGDLGDAQINIPGIPGGMIEGGAGPSMSADEAQRLYGIGGNGELGGGQGDDSLQGGLSITAHGPEDDLGIGALTPPERAREVHAEQLDVLGEYLGQRQGMLRDHADTEYQMADDLARGLGELEQSRMSASMQGAQALFGGLAALMTSENKRLFAIGKAAAIANAVVDGQQAAVAAWRHGMSIGGPPVAAAFTAGSLARTGAMIATIASQSLGGGSSGRSRGGGGGGGGGGVSSAAPAEAAPLQQVGINIMGGDVFGRDALVRMAEEIQRLSADGAVVTVRS